MNKVEAAQLRANISAYLSNNLRRHETAEVAKAVNVSNRSAGQMLRAMAQAKLIAPMETAPGGRKLWSWGEGVAPAPAPEDGRKRGMPVQQAPHPPKEVELVVHGVLVIIGKNEKTGRLRITLEEA